MSVTDQSLIPPKRNPAPAQKAAARTDAVSSADVLSLYCAAVKKRPDLRPDAQSDDGEVWLPRTRNWPRLGSID